MSSYFRYIDAMEHFWAVYFTQGGLTERDFLVYSYLVHTCNALRGKNPFQLESHRAAMVLKLVDAKGRVQPEIFARCQKRLEKAGLIEWQKGRRGCAPTYRIVMLDTYSIAVADKNAQKVDRKSAKSVSESVSESVTLQGRDKKIERENEGSSLSIFKDWIEMIEGHPKWRRVKNRRHIVEKFVGHYAGRPAMMNEARLLEWFAKERNVEWEPEELPLAPAEPEHLRMAMNRLGYALDSPLRSMSWPEIYHRYGDLAQRLIEESAAYAESVTETVS